MKPGEKAGNICRVWETFLKWSLWFEPVFQAVISVAGTELGEGRWELTFCQPNGGVSKHSFPADHSCHPRLAPLNRLYDPGSWSQDSGDICFLLTQELKLNRKMCLALNWALLAGNREPLESREEQPAKSGCQGWQVLSPVILPLASVPLWSPGGMAGWAAESAHSPFDFW